MADQRLRELERRAPDSIEDEAAYLLERVRVGDLTRDRLELAANCDHHAARVATQQDAALVGSAEEFLDGLIPWGKEVLVAASVLLAYQALPAWEAYAPERDGPRQAVRAAEAWLVRPSEEERARVRECSRRAGKAAARAGRDLLTSDRASRAAAAARAAHNAARCAATVERAAAAATWAKRTLEATGDAVDSAGSDLLPALRRDLAAWALNSRVRAGGTPP